MKQKLLLCWSVFRCMKYCAKCIDRKKPHCRNSGRGSVLRIIGLIRIHTNLTAFLWKAPIVLDRVRNRLPSHTAEEYWAWLGFSLSLLQHPALGLRIIDMIHKKQQPHVVCISLNWIVLFSVLEHNAKGLKGFKLLHRTLFMSNLLLFHCRKLWIR